jgi:hypothetical protein
MTADYVLQGETICAVPGPEAVSGWDPWTSAVR